MRILIVDDTASLRALARVYAEQEAASAIVEAGDGAEAVQLAREEPFDLAIIDFHMPEMNGLEATHHLLALQPELYIIAWTSVVDPATERAFLTAGARRHVPKTDTATLHGIIRERAQATMTLPALAAA